MRFEFVFIALLFYESIKLLFEIACYLMKMEFSYLISFFLFQKLRCLFNDYCI
ncbi:hypothetical protein SAMN05444405_105194 [Bacteroides luti]|jgi:hypothetical protein|uniref:Uncharacterized protein n=1 Tax=Bacteroides luti TaxID=1297750 RepID=A0A1M4Z7M5_9BACE|nr:hypothetical protein SAMN05444405_105194 [Bacteroides luti]